MPLQQVADELLPVTVQLGFVAASTGRTQEALELFTSALKIGTCWSSLLS